MDRDPYLFYHKHAKEYDHWKYTPGVRKFQESEKRFLLENITPKSKVIDIGCGTGEHISEIIDKNCDIIAVDFVKDMLEIAKNKIGDRAVFLHKDIRDLSFPNNHFDFGICYCTLPNMMDYETVFINISVYCTTLITSVYHLDCLFELIEFYKMNGFDPKFDAKTKTLSISEGLKYRFIPENVVKRLYADNSYYMHVTEEKYGNIYKGIKKR